ncbi:MAG: ABC transporter permease [Acidimicrobiia bacterium]|nr:ABC transporter permease [Acidimicrobiia bacterium]
MSLRIILRNLLKTPVITSVAVLSLALGLGANTAMFSLLHQIVLSALPVADPDRLVLLYAPGPQQGSISSDESGGATFSMPTYRGMARSQTPFTGLAAGRYVDGGVAYNNAALRKGIHLVSGNYFEVLGVRASMGRLLAASDDVTQGSHPVAVLGYRYWQNELGGDPGVLNRTVVVNGYPLTIVGVAAHNFHSDKPGTVPSVFAPLSMRAQIMPGRDTSNDRRVHWLPLIGRLKKGVTLEEAQSAIQPAYAAEKEEEIRGLKGADAAQVARYRAKKIELKEGAFGRGGLHTEAQTPVLLLLGITGMVLLIACANVANLLMARSAARAREMAVRVAVGASRRQILGQLLSESLTLSALAGVAGVAVAWGTLAVLQAAVPPAAGVMIATDLDPLVLAFCAGLTLITGVAFGLFPALQASRPDLVKGLKDQAGQASSTGAANRMRQVLVTGQMGASLALLISAGMFAKSLMKLTSVDLGIRTDHLLTFSVDPQINKYSSDQARAFYEQLEARLHAIPGARLVTAGTVPAIAGDNWGQHIQVEGYTLADDQNHSFYNVVAPSYHRTMGIPLVAGREITDRDNQAGQKVVVVNETFVRRFFPRETGGATEALGRRIGLGGKPDHVIVGVVKDSNYSSIKEEPRPVFYLPYRQQDTQAGMYFYVRTAVEPEGLIAQVRREVASMDANLPISELKTMQAQINENIFEERLMTANLAAFAALATLLAAIGLYGVLAYSVARRTREIGIRMALGAAAGRIRKLVMGEVAWMLAIGGGGGAAAAWGLTRVAGRLLYGVQGPDPAVYGGAAALIVLVALVAAYVPARRASRVDPLRALRYE